MTVYTTGLSLENSAEIRSGQEKDLDGLKVTYFKYFGPNNYLFSLPLRSRLKQVVKRYDLVHLHSIWSYPSYIASRIAAENRVPALVSLHGNLNTSVFSRGYLKKSFYYNLFVRKILGNAGGVHFVSEEEVELSKRFVPSGLRSWLIPPGIDTNKYSVPQPRPWFRAEHGISGSAKIILYLGRLSWEKGLDLLLDAFKEVHARRPDTYLVLAGPAAPGLDLRAGLKASGLANRVILPGMIRGDEKKIGLLLESDLFALTSLSDAAPISVLEAMAAGLPVIVTDNIGISRQVKASDAGAVVERNVTAVCRGIMEQIDNEACARARAGKARQLAVEKFDIKYSAEKMLAAYREVIGHAG